LEIDPKKILKILVKEDLKINIGKNETNNVEVKKRVNTNIGK
jgi:hypothetical protein